MKKISLLSLVATFIFFSCSKDDEVADAVADAVACFTLDATESTDSTHTFLFDQCPPAYDLSYWDFDDGQYSSNPNPAHQFNRYGTFNVKLTVTNSAGQSNSVIKRIDVGHYSLSRIVFPLSDTINTIYPIMPYLNYFDAAHNLVYQIGNIIGSDFSGPWDYPRTYILNDSILYDNNPAFEYVYSEVHGSDSLTCSFQINNSDITQIIDTIYTSIVKGAFVKVCPLGGNNTTFNLFFTLVPR
jgi:PKD repeat protein